MNSTISLGISLVIFILIMRGQLRGTKTPIAKSGIALLLPILYISTSLLQLTDPRLHLQAAEVFIALLLGLVISLPLIAVTKFEVREDGNTYFKRDNRVFVILIAIFALRFIVVATIHAIDPSTLGFLSNLVTLSYLATWRIVTFIKFRSSIKGNLLQARA
ncbi:CcdC protein domain-containing protein [Paenibacillus sp. SI8]|uniref:CcdC protein domain-containing protein n=1 Tax=unclassified Paenibacillus TaxID=185978 RepID=UPI00346763BA